MRRGNGTGRDVRNQSDHARYDTSHQAGNQTYPLPIHDGQRSTKEDAAEYDDNGNDMTTQAQLPTQAPLHHTQGQGQGQNRYEDDGIYSQNTKGTHRGSLPLSESRANFHGKQSQANSGSSSASMGIGRPARKWQSNRYHNRGFKNNTKIGDDLFGSDPFSPSAETPNDEPATQGMPTQPATQYVPMEGIRDLNGSSFSHARDGGVSQNMQQEQTVQIQPRPQQEYAQQTDAVRNLEDTIAALRRELAAERESKEDAYTILATTEGEHKHEVSRLQHDLNLAQQEANRAQQQLEVLHRKEQQQQQKLESSKKQQETETDVFSRRLAEQAARYVPENDDASPPGSIIAMMVNENEGLNAQSTSSGSNGSKRRRVRSRPSQSLESEATTVNLLANEIDVDASNREPQIASHMYSSGVDLARRLVDSCFLLPRDARASEPLASSSLFIKLTHIVTAATSGVSSAEWSESRVIWLIVEQCIQEWHRVESLLEQGKEQKNLQTKIHLTDASMLPIATNPVETPKRRIKSPGRILSPNDRFGLSQQLSSSVIELMDIVDEVNAGATQVSPQSNRKLGASEDEEDEAMMNQQKEDDKEYTNDNTDAPRVEVPQSLLASYIWILRQALTFSATVRNELVQRILECQLKQIMNYDDRPDAISMDIEEPKIPTVTKFSSSLRFPIPRKNRLQDVENTASSFRNGWWMPDAEKRTPPINAATNQIEWADQLLKGIEHCMLLQNDEFDHKTTTQVFQLILEIIQHYHVSRDAIDSASTAIWWTRTNVSEFLNHRLAQLIALQERIRSSVKLSAILRSSPGARVLDDPLLVLPYSMSMKSMFSVPHTSAFKKYYVKLERWQAHQQRQQVRQASEIFEDFLRPTRPPLRRTAQTLGESDRELISTINADSASELSLHRTMVALSLAVQREALSASPLDVVQPWINAPLTQDGPSASKLVALVLDLLEGFDMTTEWQALHELDTNVGALEDQSKVQDWKIYFSKMAERTKLDWYLECIHLLQCIGTKSHGGMALLRTRFWIELLQVDEGAVGADPSRQGSVPNPISVDDESSGWTACAVEVAICQLHKLVTTDYPSNSESSAFRKQISACIEGWVRFFHQFYLIIQRRTQFQELSERNSGSIPSQPSEHPLVMDAFNFRSILLEFHELYTSACVMLLAREENSGESEPYVSNDIKSMIMLQLEELEMDEEDYEDGVAEREVDG